MLESERIMSRNWRKITLETRNEAVAYYRVSTTKQERSGLGLEAQRETVTRYAQRSGLEVVREYTEVETGTRKKVRPQLLLAIAEAKKRGCVLLIAKIDRLARNVHFVSGLLESGVEFVACDMPEANKLTVHVMAAMAEHESDMISTRVREALAAAKRRGVKLGKPENLTKEAAAKGQAVTAQAARDAYRTVEGYIQHLRDSGSTLQAVADRLNAEGQRTRTGAKFTPTHISRILGRRLEGVPLKGKGRSPSATLVAISDAT